MCQNWRVCPSSSLPLSDTPDVNMTKVASNIPFSVCLFLALQIWWPKDWMHQKIHMHTQRLISNSAAFPIMHTSFFKALSSLLQCRAGHRLMAGVLCRKALLCAAVCSVLQYKSWDSVEKCIFLCIRNSQRRASSKQPQQNLASRVQYIRVYHLRVPFSVESFGF